MSVNLENWNYTSFSAEQRKAFISYCAEPKIEDSGLLSGDFLETYQVNYQDKQTESNIFQKNFKKLDLAVDFINSHYGHLTFTDMSAPSSGCDSCGNS